MTTRIRHRGTVLIIVVVLVMLLSLIAYKYLLAMQTEHMVTAAHGDRIQAQQSAQSVCDLLKLMLTMSRSERDALGGLSDNPAFFAGSTLTLQGNQSTSTVAQPLDTAPFGLIAYPVSQRQPAMGIRESRHGVATRQRSQQYKSNEWASESVQPSHPLRCDERIQQAAFVAAGAMGSR